MPVGPWVMGLHVSLDMTEIPTPPEVAANRTLGRALVFVARIFLYFGTFGALYLAFRPWPELSTDVTGLAARLGMLLAVGLLFGVVGSVMLGYGRRLQIPPGEPLVLDRTRPLVLYLRSFAIDSDIVPGTEAELAFRETSEEALARRLEGVGAMVAIGRPGEPLPPIGAPRIYRSDAEWQASVLDLMARARLTVLAFGSSRGLGWEIGAALANVPAGRLLLWFPTRALWHVFRDFARTDPRWTRGLPRTAADVRFLGFREDGTPRVLEVHVTTIPDDFATVTTPDATGPGEISPGGLEAYLLDVAADDSRPPR